MILLNFKGTKKGKIEERPSGYKKKGREEDKATKKTKNKYSSEWHSPTHRVVKVGSQTTKK